MGSIPGFGRSPGGGHGNPLQCSGESPWTEEPGGLHSMGSVAEWDMTKRLSTAQRHRDT